LGAATVKLRLRMPFRHLETNLYIPPLPCRIFGESAKPPSQNRPSRHVRDHEAWL
jgi:hypothetical protein